MITKIQKWGDSYGIRLPKYLLEALQCIGDDKVTVSVDKNRLIIEKASMDSKPSISDLFADYNGTYRPQEVDLGEPVGEEVW